MDRAAGTGGADHPEGQGLDLLHLSVPWWELVIRSAVIYAAFFIALRVFGKREVGQFTLYDLVLILLAANAVQPAMTGPDSSLLGGLIIVATLVILNFLVAQLDQIEFFHRILRDKATVIIQDGQFLKAAMHREGVIQEDAETAIREHGLENVKEVKLGVLEPDGNISIVGTDNSPAKQKPIRRRRFLRRH